VLPRNDQSSRRTMFVAPRKALSAVEAMLMYAPTVDVSYREA
jgi:hypothetical protein